MNEIDEMNVIALLIKDDKRNACSPSIEKMIEGRLSQVSAINAISASSVMNAINEINENSQIMKLTK